MVYFDADGVLFPYDRNDYKGEKPPFIDLDKHVYLEKTADTRMKPIVLALSRVMPEELGTLSTVHPEPIIRAHQVIDKVQSIIREYPEINPCHIQFVSTDKRNFISDIRQRSLTKRDILFDDYNPNLYSWHLAGGLAVKVLNGNNSLETWHGDVIDIEHDPTEEIIGQILDLVQKV